MGKYTNIAWTDHSFNPWWGCTKITDGCKFCYAERQAARFGSWWGNSPRRVFGPAHWREPIVWNAHAARYGVYDKVFVGSMCDLFENRGDVILERERLFTMVDNLRHLIWQFLTKRPENIMPLTEKSWRNSQEWYREHPNVWVGASAENQVRLNHAVTHLITVPAPIRFISAEPLLGELDLVDAFYGVTGQDFRRWWLIIGGESGPNARPMHPFWVDKLIGQAKGLGMPVFFKQWGAWRLKGTPSDQPVKEFGVLSRSGEWYPGHTGWNGRAIDPDTDEAYMIRVSPDNEHDTPLVEVFGDNPIQQFPDPDFSLARRL